jgi:hypothetical protein
MQASGDFVAATAEFTASVQGGHNNLKGRHFFLWMNVYRNTAPIIYHGNTAVWMDGDFYTVANPSQGFIDRIIYHLVNQVMERFKVCTADIHTWSPAYSL